MTSVCLEAQGIEGDEAGGVVLVVSFFLSAFHSSNCFIVKSVHAAATGVDDISFVKFDSYFTGNFFLSAIDEGLNRFAFRRKPEAIIDELGIFGDEAITHVLGFAINDESLEVLMSGEEDGSAGRFVDATRFHANKAVFDDVNSPNSVSSAKEVENSHDAIRIEEGVTVRLATRGDVPEFGNDFIKAVSLDSDTVSFFK